MGGKQIRKLGKEWCFLLLIRAVSQRTCHGFGYHEVETSLLTSSAPLANPSIEYIIVNWEHKHSEMHRNCASKGTINSADPFSVIMVYESLYRNEIPVCRTGVLSTNSGK